MSNFFKSSAFVKSFFVFGAAFFATLSISCKQLASFDPVVNGEQTVVSGGTTSETAEFAFNLKATHGLVRKISLEWTAFSGAKYYEIYFAESSSAEFAKIGETEQPFFDDAVGAGRTGYFKVCAVKANGASSPFSSTVVGTSLAVPIISDGEVGESEANISWSMENARGIDGTDYYEKTLKFEVVCQPKGGSDGETKVLSASSFSGSSYSCKFENLSSSQDYEFYIEAYLEGDTQSREKSPTVDKTTLTAYTPLAPKFTASEGDNAKGISLLITLPEMVTVKTFVKDSENPKIKQDVPYPLCFEIWRKHEKEEAYLKKETLYYDGQNLITNSVEYQENGAGAPYEAGKQVVWFDSDPSLIGGEKYDYEIVSVPDVNYSKVVCLEDNLFDNSENKRTPKEKVTTAQGWKSASPSFDVKSGDDGGRKLSADKTKVVSVTFAFSAEWKDLGKAGDYKFAIRQKRTPFEDENGEETWLKNGGTIYFDTLDGIKAFVKTFGSDSGLSKNEQGTYSYTLYIVSKNDNGTDEIESKDNILDSMTARNKVVVTEEVKLPKAELTVKGGYKNKVHYKFACEPNVEYRLERTKAGTDKPEYISLANTSTSDYFEGDDTEVQDNCRYSYVLKAVAASGVPAYSTAQVAETLGTPKVSFKKDEESFGYDSVTISFDGVLAAKDYSVTLGTKGGFGGGIPYTFAAGSDSTSGNMKVLLAGNTYTVTINNPEGYNDAKKAGISVDAVVMADSGEDTASGSVPVNVLGPALLDAKVNTFDEAKEDSISLTWKAVDGAKGYLIRRVMYSDVGMTKVADGSGVTYYYEVASRTITTDVDSEAIGERATVADSDAGFKFTDKYMEITTEDETLKEYQEKQAKLAWGLPFRYVVLPVLKKDDFDFEDSSLELDRCEVAYANLAEKQTDGTATFGYGLNVRAKKSESVTTQNVTWEKPFYGDKNLTPKVYRRKFADNDKNEWEAVDSTIKNCGIDYSPSGDDRYCAWEYVVKYRKDRSDKIAQSYVDWLKDSDHDETRYDYGNAAKEKLNKGYLLAMNYSAYYGGGENPSKTDADYYSEDVVITQWYYSDRALGPDKVELKVLSLDLAAGWQSVGTLDSEITSFTASDLTDTTVEANLNDKVIKLKPTEISNNKNGKGTTKGPLKILRSAKHYYGLNLSRGGNEYFDCKNYEEYAYRQITDEEIVKSTMLVVAYMQEKAHSQDSATGGSGNYNGYNGNSGSGSFEWDHNSDSRYRWSFSSFVYGYDTLPCGEDIYKNALEYYYDTNVFKNFFRLTDSASLATRGRKYSTSLVFLCKDDHKNFGGDKKIPINIVFDLDEKNKKMKSYNPTTVNFSLDIEHHKFYAECNGTSFEEAGSDEMVRKWIPISATYKYVFGGMVMGGSTNFHCKDSAYGWWDNN